MSKKSQKASSQQQQHQQQQQQQTNQPQNQPEAAPHKRQTTSTQPRGASSAIRDSCHLFSASLEADPLVAPNTKQVRGGESNADKLSQPQPVQAGPKLERDKRVRLQLTAAGAENKPLTERMGESRAAGLAPAYGQAVVDMELNEQNICAACAKPIRERYLLMALDKRWHEDCLKCACCDCRLGEVGSSLFTHSDKLLCRRDFLRIFGKKGLCAACHRQIPAYELVMRAQENAYHMDCFACQRCQYRFCVGDQFHMTQAHKIICLLCHREQLERCQQQQQAQEREVAISLAPAQLGGAFDEQPELAADCEQRQQLAVNKQHQQEDDEKPPLKLTQLANVERAPPEPVESTLVACPVQQMRLPSQKERERACVM